MKNTRKRIGNNDRRSDTVSWWYYLANHTKREFVDNAILMEGPSIHLAGMLSTRGAGRLLMYLVEDPYYPLTSNEKITDDDRWNPEKPDDDEFYFGGHWAGDAISLVTDAGAIVGSNEDRPCDKYQLVYMRYTNITIPAVKEYNNHYAVPEEGRYPIVREEKDTDRKPFYTLEEIQKDEDMM